MIKFFFYLFALFFIVFFCYKTFSIYFSDKVQNEIIQNRINISNKIDSKITNLKTLSNDTNNIIIYNSGFENEKIKNPKRNFWELINSK